MRIHKAWLLGVLLVGICGCSTGKYWESRRRDAGDVWTADTGHGGGVKARAGLVNVGVFVNIDQDQADTNETVWVGDGVSHAECTAILFSQERYHPPTEVGYERHKAYQSMGVAGVTVAETWDGRLIAWELVPYYTQLEVGLGVGRTVRLGINPGELVDFLLGLVYIDLFGDDVALGRGAVISEQ